MNITGKIGKAILWSIVGYVVLLVFDHYAKYGGLPSSDPLTNFFVFLGIGGVIYWIDTNKEYVRHWLIYDQGRKLLFALGWAVSLGVVFVRYGNPDWVPVAVPIPASLPMVVQMFAVVFLMVQAYRLAKWILF